MSYLTFGGARAQKGGDVPLSNEAHIIAESQSNKGAGKSGADLVPGGGFPFFAQCERGSRRIAVRPPCYDAQIFYIPPRSLSQSNQQQYHFMAQTTPFEFVLRVYISRSEVFYTTAS